MSVNQLLKEMDENKPEPMTLEPIVDKPISASFSLADKKEIIRKYLEGKVKKEIAHEYGVPTISITKIVEQNSDIRLETEKRYQSVALSRENYRLSETKDKILSFIDTTLEEVATNPGKLTTENKLRVLNNVAVLFDKLSITSRLNSDKPTNISEERNIKVDINKVLEKLPTTEDKLNFLRRQNTTGDIIDVDVEK